MAAETGEGLAEILKGVNNLPESAATKFQKPLPPGIGFNWKPSDEETQRDIEEAKRWERETRAAVKFVEEEERMALERSRIDPKALKIPKGILTLGDQFKSLIGDIKKSLKFPDPDALWEEAGKRGKNTKLLKKKSAELAVDLNPVGAAVGIVKEAAPLAKRIITDLGNDVTLTPSAKEVGKYQITHWEGKAGISNTVQDEVFDTADEALTALQKYEATNK